MPNGVIRRCGNEEIMGNILKGIAPDRVFFYFESISAIPRGSGNTKAISDYCMRFAEEHGLEAWQDEWNNVLIRKPASPGYEEHPPVILQGHLDMVCEKEPDSPHDFLKDGLSLFVDGDWIGAAGTTLGGDDGIAVAMGLAVLEDQSLPHPPLEVLFTTDEETGMYGAAGLDPSWITGRTLLNLDSESEGILTVSCAGGARCELTLPLSRAALSQSVKKVVVDGLKGGHSGTEINKGRLNANRVLAEFLATLPSFRLVTMEGGLKDNAIPRSAFALIAADADLPSMVAAFVEKARSISDPDLSIRIEDAPDVSMAFTAADSRKACEFLLSLPLGVQAMSREIEGLVETSLNLGILRTDRDGLVASFSVRSSVNRSKDILLETLVSITADFGGSSATRGHYPAWEYKKDSRLRRVMVETYEKTAGRRPVVEAIHAGLECGLFADKLPGLDAVSIGPDMRDIHTSRERLSIPSVKRTYDYVLAVLRSL